MVRLMDQLLLQLRRLGPQHLMVEAAAALNSDQRATSFAVVAEKFIRDLNLDRDKVNVNGGAMALGHPIGATGAILINTVIDELERRGQRYGLVTMCAAGGMAPAVIVEAMN